ncbi:MAG: orotate phosphoribosyltransferase [SAR324 cluster bacterium]|nr:orotate phosphoribosyltransferase [SAR324 cluster bacterium]
MKGYKSEFIEFLVKEKALKFGEFQLKSGRISPYFFNASSFNSGETISKLGYYYAATLQEMIPQSTLVFGPAYKGIPLCIATVIALATHFDRDIGYFFNRKEAKTHGDQGILVGHAPVDSDQIVMVDDVITDGATKQEAISMIQAISKAHFTGVIIAVDRMETNAEGKDTVSEFQSKTRIPVKSIVTIGEICEYLLGREIDGKVYLTDTIYQKIDKYLQTYCIRH